jgi:phosphopantetheinyl transferase
MPLVLNKRINSDTIISAWKITESINFFQERLIIHDEERSYLADLSDRRFLEWHASRYLLHLISNKNERISCLYDAYGKPYLSGSEMQISLSHSKDYVAAAISGNTIGVDIQCIVPKISRIKHKFLHDRELSDIDPEHEINQLHIFWGAKECLYKAYGRKKLEFKSDIHIASLSRSADTQILKGCVYKGKYHKHFIIHHEKIESFILVYALENIEK